MKRSVKRIGCLLFAVALLLTPLTATAAGTTQGYGKSDVLLQTGSSAYAVDDTYVYTVYTFKPTETGKYLFHSPDSLLGIVSYNGMWVTIQPSATTVAEHSVSWQCTGVGQRIWIAVKADGETANITVSMEATDAPVEIPWTNYTNQVKPTAFTLSGNKAKLVAVDTTDTTAEAAVLGRDGYYHLNKATGPILYAKLSDSKMSLAAANSYGQLKYTTYSGDKVVGKVDFTAAFTEYNDCMDSSTALYPLTVDLIEIFQKVGEYRDWYGEDGWVGGTLADNWMFACYYIPPILGDMNSNEVVDSRDAIYLLYHTILPETYPVNGETDMDGDGDIDSDDAICLLYHVMLPDIYPF